MFFWIFLIWLLSFLASGLCVLAVLQSGLFGFLAFGFLTYFLSLLFFGFFSWLSAFGFLSLLCLWPLWLWLSASSASPATPQHHPSVTAFWLFGFLVGGFLPSMFL